MESQFHVITDIKQHISIVVRTVVYGEHYHLDETTDTIIPGYLVKKILRYKIARQPSYFDNLVQLGNC